MRLIRRVAGIFGKDYVSDKKTRLAAVADRLGIAVGIGMAGRADARDTVAVHYCGGVGLYTRSACGKIKPARSKAGIGFDVGNGVCLADAVSAAADCGADAGSAVWQSADAAAGFGRVCAKESIAAAERLAGHALGTQRAIGYRLAEQSSGQYPKSLADTVAARRQLGFLFE